MGRKIYRKNNLWGKVKIKHKKKNLNNSEIRVNAAFVRYKQDANEHKRTSQRMKEPLGNMIVDTIH